MYEGNVKKINFHSDWQLIKLSNVEKVDKKLKKKLFFNIKFSFLGELFL